MQRNRQRRDLFNNNGRCVQYRTYKSTVNSIECVIYNVVHLSFPRSARKVVLKSDKVVANTFSVGKLLRKFLLHRRCSPVALFEFRSPDSTELFQRQHQFNYICGALCLVQYKPVHSRYLDMLRRVRRYFFQLAALFIFHHGFALAHCVGYFTLHFKRIDRHRNIIRVNIKMQKESFVIHPVKVLPRLAEKFLRSLKPFFRIFSRFRAVKKDFANLFHLFKRDKRNGIFIMRFKCLFEIAFLQLLSVAEFESHVL